MTQEIDIAALRKAAQEATGGSWIVNGKQSIRGADGEYIAKTNWRDGAENAAHIAAANPAVILALLDRLEQAEKERDELKAGAFPMQPIHVAEDGCIRFKKNRIVDDMLEHSRKHGFGLNEMAMRDYTDDERMQLAQLIGYSVSGYGNLSYASEESVAKADDVAEAIRAAMQGESA